ncbi:MAG: hypothetical protein ACPG20_03625, partial [Pontimonas sp.]
ISIPIGETSRYRSGFADGFGLSAEAWTIVILVVATLIGSTTALFNSSPSYVLVLVWAFWGILSRHLSPSEWNQEFSGVILATQILLPILGIVSVVALVRWVRQPVADWASTSVRRS